MADGPILLAGAFGQRNPGDEALLRAFVRELGADACVATSSDPLGTRVEHGVEAVHARERIAVARRLAASDAVVIAGGTVFKTLAPSCRRPPLALLRSALALTLGARALGRPVALVGVGAGRLEGRARRLARALVHAADLLIVRDEESAAALAATGAPAPFRVAADPAWTLLEPPVPAPARNGGPTQARAVVVAVGRHAGGRPLAARLTAALAPIAAAGVPVRLQPWQVGDEEPGGLLPRRRRRGTAVDDATMAHAIAGGLRRRGLPAEVVPPPADLADARALLAGARLVVATRFHATLAAAGAGVPFLALVHEHKLAAVARRLRQPALPAEAPATRIAEGIAAALDHPPPAAALVRREVETAREAFRLLRVLLSRGRCAESEEIVALPLAPGNPAWGPDSLGANPPAAASRDVGTEPGSRAGFPGKTGK